MKLLKLFILTMGLLVTTLSMADIMVQADTGAGFDSLWKHYLKVNTVGYGLAVTNVKHEFMLTTNGISALKDFNTKMLNATVFDKGSLHHLFPISTFPADAVVSVSVFDWDHSTSPALYNCAVKITFYTQSDLDKNYVFKIHDLSGLGCELSSSN